MKTLTFPSVVLILLLVSVVVAISKAPKPELQKFRVEYSIVYNAITLQEAAELEQEIKDAYEEACAIKIIIDQEMSNGIPFSSYILRSDSTSFAGDTMYIDDIVWE